MMYIVFASAPNGELDHFLSGMDHTRINASSSWRGADIPAQVICVFDLSSALAIKSFLENVVGQRVVPIYRVIAEPVSAPAENS